MTVADGKLTINIRSEDKAININYIIIRKEAEDPLEIILHDVNLDGRENAPDISILDSWVLGRDVKIDDPEAADCDGDGVISSFDIAILRRYVQAAETAK